MIHISHNRIGCNLKRLARNFHNHRNGLNFLTTRLPDTHRNYQSLSLGYFQAYTSLFDKPHFKLNTHASLTNLIWNEWSMPDMGNKSHFCASQLFLNSESDKKIELEKTKKSCTKWCIIWSQHNKNLSSHN